MICEWGVRSVKKLESRYAADYDVPLANKAVRSSNVINNIKETHLDSVLCEDLKENGSHGSRQIKLEDIAEIR